MWNDNLEDLLCQPEDRAEAERVMKKREEAEVHLDKIRGCLYGGAVGDALGYPVEFSREKEIFLRYGSGGIQEYELDSESGKALISDDTQMTLFTANGILVGITRGCMRGIGGPSRSYVRKAYEDWLRTQEVSFAENRKKLHNTIGENISWLSDVPALYSRRLPGNTCLSAIRYQMVNNTYVYDYIKEPQNNRKGCGGVMRVAPLALCGDFYWGNLDDLDYEGAELAAITHGHSLGYMPAAVLTHIIRRIVFPEQRQTLKEIVLEARDAAARIFEGDQHLQELTDIIDLAVQLSENTDSDLENIHRIGEGWVAEETLGISIYCSLRYPDDFSAGVIAAVNHKGDSDSTGAVTGNILGALLGYDAIEDKWKQNLELSDVILEMADDLCYGCSMDEYGAYRDYDWERKYIHARWKEDCERAAAETIFLAVKGDITKVPGVSAIVNAANTSLLGGGGVDGAIHQAAGPELLEECRMLHGCRTGEAKITKAYNLPCDFVIHTPGPIWYGGNGKERELLASCYRSSLELAVENGIRKIAFPSISTGVYHFPMKEAAKIAIETAKKFAAEHPGKLELVMWVLFNDRSRKVYADELERMETSDIV